MRATLHQRKIIFLALSVAQICGTAHAADDKSTIGAAMELFGYSSDPSAASIEYRERAKLVLPPRLGDLPAPTEKDAQIEGWPRDPGGARKRSSDRYAKVPNAPPPEKKPGLLERIRGPRPEAAPGTDDEPGLLQRMIARRQSQTLSMEEPSRRMLTDPPAGYRQPTMDLNAVGEVGAKKSGWLNPFGLMGKNDENDPVAQAGDLGESQPQSGNREGFISRMLPSFMKEGGN